MANTVGPVAAPPAADEAPEHDEDRPLTELAEQLGRDVVALAFREAQLEASRHIPAVRRAARELAAAAAVAVAFLAAFVFANVAALEGLAAALPGWLAALVLAAAWLGAGSLLAFVLMARAGRVTGWKWWRVFSVPPTGTEELEQVRDDAAQAVRDSLGRLAPALSIEIATASVGIASEVAGDVAGDLVEAGQDLLEDSDDVVEAMTDDLPGGGVVNLMWDVVLLPGRVGLKVATTVIKRADPGN